MNTELAALAEAGASALVALMMSDFWAQAKERFARFFARSPAAGTAGEHLEASRVDLAIARAAGDAAAVAVIQAKWRVRFEELLRSDPAAAPELRQILRAPGLSQPAAVYNISSGNVHFGFVIQAGQISGGAFNVAPASDGPHGSPEGGPVNTRPPSEPCR
jgi:hypothetical protein